MIGGADISQSSANAFTYLTPGKNGAVLSLGAETITFTGLTTIQIHAGDFIIAQHPQHMVCIGDI